ncbi:hypothetical protein [Sphaerisporangium sp. NPDC051011]|uniref:hypothetical protein n=1 Tax=Sphaerisporangium sp. NPDC051011 TaxID=3155792 RepID=UPI0033D02D71
MTAERTRRTVEVRSAGRALSVECGMGLVAAWPQVAQHIPGACDAPPQESDHGVAAGVVVPDDAADARRLINAHLHVIHVAAGTVPVHAVAVQRPGAGAVLLLGGHGAGKTLVGVALALRGWQWLAGDVALVDVPAEGGPVVRGGTSAVLGRRDPLRRWFPELDLPEEGPGVVDLRQQRALQPAPVSVPVVAAVLVDVDGDPARRAALERLDRHTVATAWLLASGHLLERLLDEGEQPLRLLEDEMALRRRIRCVRALAGLVGAHLARGAPQEIAARIERLTDDRQVRT